MTDDQIAQIIEQLKTVSGAAWDTNDTEKGDLYYKAASDIEDWINGGRNGPMPVDLAEYDLDLSSLPAETPTDIPAPAVASPIDADAVTRRQQAEQASKLDDLRRRARQAEAANRESEADDLWRQVLTIAPDDPEANHQLRLRSQQHESKALRQQLVELRSKANSENITDLDTALRIARNLLSNKELLTEEQQQQVQDFETKATSKRSELKAIAGEIETAAGLGNLQEAIADLEAEIKLGRYEFEDRDGNIVTASDKLAEYNQEYAGFCTQKTREYLERSELSLPAYPRAADQVLQQAQEEFDAADPAVRDELQRRRTEIGELITRWERAQDLVAQGRHEENPEKRLALFLEAQGYYSGFKNLDSLIQDTTADAAAAVVSGVKNMHDRARYVMNQGDLDEAQAEAMRARDRAREMRGTSEALDAELVKVDALMVEITEMAGVKQWVDEAKIDVEALLAKHEFETALELIVGLPENVREQQTIKGLESQITRKRGADAVIRLAETRFDGGDYEGVLELVDPERIQGRENAQTVMNDPRSAELRRRASARQSYIEGIELVNEDPETAKTLLEHARLTDSELADDVKPHLLAIAGWETRRGDVQNLLDSASQLLLTNPPKYAESFAELSKAKNIDSPLKNEALDRWLSVGTEWREALIAELDRERVDSLRAGEIIKTLRTEAPSGDRGVQEYINEKERAHHQERARKATQSERWQDAANSWRAYLVLDRDDLEAQAGLRRSLRQQALEDAEEMFLSSSDGGQTLTMLEKRLQQRELRRDPLFLEALVNWSCKFQDFERAEKYLASLTLVEGGDSALVSDCNALLRESRAWNDAVFSSKDALKASRYAVAVRMLDDVIKDYPSAAAIQDWRNERDDVRKQAVNSLLEEAREKKPNASGVGKIEVISLYSQVLQLDESNREAKDGLREVKGELPSMVRSIVDDALRFKVDNRDADEALHEAERLLDKLHDFRAVADYMGEDGERQGREVDDAVRKLSIQRDQLRHVSNLLHEARDALDAPISDQSVERASRRLQDAKQTIPTATGINEMQEEVKHVKEERGNLNEYIKDLKDAVHNDADPESLQEIIEAVRSIRQLDPEDRYQLQTPQSLNTYDDFSNEQPKILAEFEQLAKLRQESYRIYSDWDRKCTPQYQAFVAGQEEIRDRRSRGSLEELQESLERVLAVGEHALAIFSEPPSIEANSFLDVDIEEKVEKWQQEVEKAMSTLEIDQSQAKSKREHRDTTDDQLRMVLGRRAVTVNRNLADRLLQELSNADPNWRDLPRRERQVQVWKENAKGGILGRLRNRN